MTPENVPSPGSYNISSEFKKTSLKSKNSHTFGVGRNAFAKTSITLSGINPDPNLPGPGAYSTKAFFRKKQGPSISFGLKTKVYGKPLTLDQFETSRKSNVPGPGSYTTRAPPGRYVESSLPNFGSPVYKKPTMASMKSLKTVTTPGPGTYQTSKSLKNGASYVLSTEKRPGYPSMGVKLPNNEVR